MATTDPRYYIKHDVVCEEGGDLALITKDDNVTLASVLCEYERGPEDIKHIFYTEGYDVLVKFGEPRVRSIRPIQDVPVHFQMRYPVTVITVNKYDPILGTLVCTATTMQAKARTAIRAAVATSAQTATGAVPAYTLRVVEEAGKNEWSAGLNVWSTQYFIEYMSG